MEYSLILDGVTKRFGSFVAVDDLSLRIPKGSVYGFLGPNGAGKTTTIRMVMSIFYPDSGTISVLGHPNAEEVKDRLGYLPEEKGLYKKMKAGEIVAYFGRLKGLDARTAWTRATELLSRYGLGDWIDKRCESLSKGMSQKVQVLGTLIHEPELVILDEPFSGLDPVNAELMREIILQMKREGRTVIFSTHVMEHAEQLCDYIFLINKGRKVLREIPAVARINDAGKSAELFLKDGRDPQEVLADLIGRLRIRRFDIREPSLHEIFIRAVGGKSDE
jgi:ABC-2 type transport system ATP-binding protein